jgi:hypothetical protein
MRFHTCLKLGSELTARELDAANHLGQRIDWGKAAEVTSRNEGVAREIGGIAQ